MRVYLVGKNKDFLKMIEQVLHASDIKDTHMLIGSEITPQQLTENTVDCEVLVASPSGFANLSKEHMESMPNLKLITTTSVGVDWVDTKAARDLNITVSNEKGVNAESVAQHCFGMILDLTKKISLSDRDMRQEQVGGLSKYTGTELFGKTLGIVGLGDIGKKVLRISGGFSMRVLGVNKSKKEVPSVELVDLDTLFTESDVIVVAVPLNNETENLISTVRLNLVKKGAILVSISREDVIDKEAVIAAVESGQLGGYAFDAQIGASMKKDDPWLQLDNIIVTPHSASLTVESDRGYATMTVENISAFLKGEPIRVVN